MGTNMPLDFKTTTIEGSDAQDSAMFYHPKKKSFDQSYH